MSGFQWIAFDCETCAADEQPLHALLHGYLFGGRELEDVWFEVRVGRDHSFTVRVATESAVRFRFLHDQGGWLEAAREFAARQDVFTCPKCRGDVIIPEDQEWRWS